MEHKIPRCSMRLVRFMYDRHPNNMPEWLRFAVRRAVATTDEVRRAQNRARMRTACLLYV